MNPYSDTLSSEEAAARLGVKLQTLYAYTSRGWIRSVPGGHGPARQYLRADVERLHARGEARRGGPPAGAPALRYGEPVMDSAITWLDQEGPLYRGHRAVALAEANQPFESVAELLWTGALPETPPHWGVEGIGLPLDALRGLVPSGGPVLGVLPIVVAALGAADVDRYGTSPEAVLPRARVLIRRATAALVLTQSAFEPERIPRALAAQSVAESLAIAVGARSSAPALRAINRALVLLADHELNASTFTARVAASTNADVYACVGAGLASLSGPRHGAASARVHALVREIGHPERAAQVLRERLGRGEHIPGFGHMVYRVPDPRALPLLESARQLAPRSRIVRSVDALIDAMREAQRPPVNVDTAIVSLAGALGMPAELTPALFAIGRLAGWIAHILEQYAADFLVRPRARYLDPDATE
jgi:citrate synthase